MHMAELKRPQLTPAAVGNPGSSDADQWRRLFEQLSAELAAPLTRALDRVQALVATGRISRQDLRALHGEVEAAREAGMVGQQLARYGSPTLRPVHEQVELSGMIAGALNHRSRELHARGLEVAQALKPVEVVVDPAMLSTLMHTVLTWAFDNAQSHLELRCEVRSGGGPARVTCRFAYGGDPGAAAPTGADARARLDGLSWRLVEGLARAMGLIAHRLESGRQATLTIDFPRTVNEEAAGVSAVELSAQSVRAGANNPVAGHHVLVLASDAEMRREIHDAIQHLGLIVDDVRTVDEAAAFCREGLPHAIVFDGSLEDDALEDLRGQIRAQAPDFVFVEIIDDASMFEVSSFSSSGMAHVGRDAIGASLPTALLFELTRSL
jgi:hypothetical protein